LKIIGKILPIAGILVQQQMQQLEGQTAHLQLDEQGPASM
jgi:hypothetical protein